MSKGKLPLTEKMILESNESQWRLLINGLINELPTSALIEMEPEKKVRVKLIIENILPPERIRTTDTCNVTTNIAEFSPGMARMHEFLNNYIGKNTWLFIGYIDGENKAPILITYYVLIDIFIYTQKLESEERKDFLSIAQQN